MIQTIYGHKIAKVRAICLSSNTGVVDIDLGKNVLVRHRLINLSELRADGGLREIKAQAIEVFGKD